MFYHSLKIVLVFCIEITVINSHGRDERSGSKCFLPRSVDKTWKISDKNNLSITSAKAGSPVYKGATIDYKCAKGYSFADGCHTAKSTCQPSPEGYWQPTIKTCHRFCPPLKTTIHKVNLTCKYEDRDVECEDSMLSGTFVTPQCKALHHANPEFDSENTTIRCLSSGGWSKSLLKCDPDCGVLKNQTMVSGGSVAAPAQFPWHVAIYSIPKGYLLICGGTLVAPNVVLSAAHCFYSEVMGLPMTKSTDYVIAVGKTTRNHTKIDGKAQKMVEVSEILFYEKPYNPKTNGYTADIALINLKERIELSTYVLPACLRPHNQHDLDFNPGKGVVGLLVGWGLDENSLLSEELKTMSLPFVPYNECVKKMSGMPHDKFCAGSDRPSGPRPQPGDGGGGLLFKDPVNQLYYLRGIASTTDKFSDTALTAFTDISYYQEWIDRIIQEQSEDE